MQLFFFFCHLAQITMNSVSEAAALLSIGSAISIHFIRRETETEERGRGESVGKKMLFQCRVAQLRLERSVVEVRLVKFSCKSALKQV